VIAVVLLLAFAADFDWKLPKGFPAPAVPRENPMSAGKVELGRWLFYEKKMSGNGTQSCASCHRQELAFTDAKTHATGSTGQPHPRGAMSLVNVAYVPLLTWANPELKSLEEQALIPMFGTDPVELGVNETAFLNFLREDATYKRMFAAAALSITTENVVKAIASFERTIISARSPYDRGELSQSAERGKKLFFGDRLKCAECHGQFTFGGEVRFEGSQEPHVWYFNTGLTAVNGTGLQALTHNRGDVGRFRPPTLRNIAFTAPYMHDGSIATLEEVIDHYASGGASQAFNKSPLVSGFAITDHEKTDLLAFLRSLTDEELLKDERWSDPHRPSVIQ
jgi:cytochrome c peroxidase